MLAEDVKARIQSVYRQMLESRELTPRYGQRLMIAEIAKCLSVLATDDEHPAPLCVVEAGTGTGKTLAYLLAVLPLAQELNLKVVIATATVALQEQVILKDIPELLAGSDMSFSFSLAKGRGRYVCLAKLDSLLSGNDSLQAMMDLYGDEGLGMPGAGDLVLYQEMLDALGAGQWQGDRDDWPSLVTDKDWIPLTVDNAQCMGPKCSHFRSCCFYQARESMDKADCIVSNHDLVLSDLALGGGVILPDPQECIYIFDEAHHLPMKSNNHFASFTRIRGTQSWLERVVGMTRGLVQDDFLDAAGQKGLEALITQLRGQLEQTWHILDRLLQAMPEADHYENRRQHTFKHGVIPDDLREEAVNLGSYFTRLLTALQGITDEIKLCLEEAPDLDRKETAERWFPVLGATLKRAESCLGLWLTFAAPDPAGRAPVARWLTTAADDAEPEVFLSATPVLAAENLAERLWETCAGAVLTSATLSSLGNFDMLRLRAGLPEHTHYLRIPSPFPFAEAATFNVPRLNCDPSDNVRHSQLIIAAIPRLLSPQDAALMLFSSRRQMQEVLAGLPSEWQDRVLCQDDFQKAQLLKYHRKRIDEGEGSLIFGLASFAEGVDLPGKYCTHVLIAKIPFAVPNDPVEMTLSDWVEEQGKNPFMTLAVPDAAFKLLQASGRLLRHEEDRGQITLFDERIVNRRYGKSILESLPPYRRDIFTLDLSDTAG